MASKPLPSLRAAVLAAILVAAGSPAVAEYPVIDAASVSEAVENLKAATEQVKQLNAMLGQVQSIVQTVGQQGLPSILFNEALSQSGISQFGPPVKELLDTASSTLGSVQGIYQDGKQAANSLKDVLDETNRLKGQLNSLAAKPDFSSFSSTQAWVKTVLTTEKDASVTAVNLTRKARSMLAGEAAADGYAMALSARQQVSTMADRAQKLAQQVGAAKDLRGDLAANTAVMLAMHDEMAQVQALMAAILEVQSSSRMADADPTRSSASAAPAAAGGGN